MCAPLLPHCFPLGRQKEGEIQADTELHKRRYTGAPYTLFPDTLPTAR